MGIFMVGDIHAGLGYPNKTNKWFEIHKEYFNDFLIPLLKENAREGDIIILMGDLFDNRNVLPINIMNFIMDILYELTLIAPVHILIGNHDLWTKSTSEINSVRLFRYMNNLHLYDSPIVIEHAGKSLFMMPYIHNKNEQIDAIKANPANYMFCHSDLNGCRMHLTSSSNRKTNMIEIDEFSGYEKVYSGHIHLRQKSKNFTFVGNIFQMDRSDYKDVKGIYYLNTETNEETFFENNTSPIFVKVNITKETDLDKLSNVDSRNYIDIDISNSLLINSRKIRRRIEDILSDNSFESVSYINDTKTEKIMEDVQLNSDMSITKDYEEIIIEHINEKDYNDKLKTNLITEIKRIINVHKG